jgi:probable HAF family extracellular repeat protein
MHATLSPSWKKSLLLVFVSVVAFVTATPATSRPQCFFQGLGFLPGGRASDATGVSANGRVVVGEATGATGSSQAFRWTAASGMVGLGFLPEASDSFANGVNADGTVVVGFDINHPPPPPSSSQAFRWTAASGMVGLGFLPGGIQRSAANGVNADGTVVVGRSDGQAFRWVNGTMTGLGFAGFAFGVNAEGTVVVGEAFEAGGAQAFRWVNGTKTGLGFLPGGPDFSEARGVNADGTVVVGQALDASVQRQAFRWTAASGMVGLDFLPGGNQSAAFGVNADGTVVVGQALDASGANQAFRWTARTRMQSVLTLLLAAKVVNMAGWQLRSARGVSADGTVIVGEGTDPLGQFQGWIARLPEDNEDCNEDENEDELEGRRQGD